MMKIWHAKCVYSYPREVLIVPRRLWFKKSVGLAEITTERGAIKVPAFLKEKLVKKLRKFFFDTRGNDVYDVTIGTDDELGIWSTALVHPRDAFRKRTGSNIVIGRLKQKRKKWEDEVESK